MGLKDEFEQLDSEQLIVGFQKAMPGRRARGRILEAEAYTTMAKIHRYQEFEEFLVKLNGWLNQAVDEGRIEPEQALYTWLGSMATISTFIEVAEEGSNE